MDVQRRQSFEGVALVEVCHRIYVYKQANSALIRTRAALAQRSPGCVPTAGASHAARQGHVAGMWQKEQRLVI